ncbi:hypothetical protein RF11_15578 [Thelohanellus kitauei]|uniref:FMR1-interacting protein 1 conserved domain-containing protein n=1 Tax=Thelohanellus kitauei TaxID=669202 RepID=A0A0C2MI39_THEKT|nr:hypothetical protein RF11_15578 [Thelohanellus kitauei]
MNSILVEPTFWMFQADKIYDNLPIFMARGFFNLETEIYGISKHRKHAYHPINSGMLGFGLTASWFTMRKDFNNNYKKKVTKNVKPPTKNNHNYEQRTHDHDDDDYSWKMDEVMKKVNFGLSTEEEIKRWRAERKANYPRSDKKSEKNEKTKTWKLDSLKQKKSRKLRPLVKIFEEMEKQSQIDVIEECIKYIVANNYFDKQT